LVRERSSVRITLWAPLLPPIAALHLGDRAILLDMGQVVFEGTAQEVLDNADPRQRYLTI
jgi:hypothetical protein